MTAFSFNILDILRGGPRTGRSGAIIDVATPAWLCVLAALGLTALGVLAIDLGEFGQPVAADLGPLALRQLVFGFIGLFAAATIALPHFRLIGAFSWALLALTVLMLVFLLLPFIPTSIVRPRNGARAWIDLGVMDFQPAELAKIAWVLAVARFLRYRATHRKFTGLVLPGLITAVPVGLITLQPDLGTALMFLPSLFAVLLAAGARLRHLTIIVLVAATAGPAAYPLLKPHQKTRIIAMLKQIQGDTSTAQDINFQSYTAQTLIGAGRATGMPEDAARALIQYNRLPERHNDMIYAVVCARFGMLGGVALLALFALWLLGAWLTAATSREPQGRLIAVGLSGFVAAQVFVNVGMNLGVLPIVGITLPFVSYGGSSLVASWIMTGLILNVGLHPVRPPYRHSFEYGDGDERSA